MRGIARLFCSTAIFPSAAGRALRSISAAILLAASASAASLPALAQQEWNPFREKDELAARRKTPAAPLPPALPPMNGSGTSAVPNASGYGTAYPGLPNDAPAYSQPSGPAQRDAAAAAVERMDLPPIGDATAAAVATPVPAPVQSGSDAPPSRKAARAVGPITGPITGPLTGLQGDIWRGLDLAAIEQLIARANVPPRSPALHTLWSGLLTSAATPPSGANPVHLKAVQMEGLYRSGLIADMSAALGPTDPNSLDPLTTAFRIRRDLAEDNRVGACEATRAQIQRRADLPKALRGELHLLSGYCAAAEKNTGAAGLAAELTREEGIDAPLALAVLDSIAGGAAPNLKLPSRILLLDYRLLELLGPVDPGQILDKAEPALLAALAGPSTSSPALRAVAAEAASQINAIPPAVLAEAYRAVQATPDNDADASVRHALVLQAFDREPFGPRRDRLARVFLDDARKAGLYQAAAVIIATMPGDALSPAAADIALETALASGNYARVRALAERQAQLAHWPALADAFDPAFRGNREQNLARLDEYARTARFSSEALHTLATVLDALDLNVPIPLWEAASRTAPPNGYLPQTGVLAQLDDAAKKKELARTVLLSIGAIGPNGSGGAHIIALGDTIRALRRTGLDASARQLGLEAVLGSWPKAQAS